jgi:hypothetical protein
MRLRNLFFNRVKIIREFGKAQLIKTPDGKWELRGGTTSDHTAAKEWISLFLHEAVVEKAKSSGAESVTAAGLAINTVPQRQAQGIF